MPLTSYLVTKGLLIKSCSWHCISVWLWCANNSLWLQDTQQLQANALVLFLFVGWPLPYRTTYMTKAIKGPFHEIDGRRLNWTLSLYRTDPFPSLCLTLLSLYIVQYTLLSFLPHDQTNRPGIVERKILLAIPYKSALDIHVYTYASKQICYRITKHVCLAKIDSWYE